MRASADANADRFEAPAGSRHLAAIRPARPALPFVGVVFVVGVVGQPALAHAQPPPAGERADLPGGPVGSSAPSGPDDPDAEGAADDPAVAEARALFERGSELAEQSRYSEAAEAFARSFELVPRPSTAFNLALCQFGLGRHVQAIETLERYLQLLPEEERGDSSRQEAERMLAHARRSVATLELEVAPADARVSVDGQPVDGGPRRTVTVNPGGHIVRVDAEGHAPSLLEVEASRGERVRRAVQLESTRSLARLAIRVHDHPDARIEVDGRDVGRGEAELELEAGTHAIAVEHPGLAPYERRLELSWDERVELAIAPARSADRPLAEEPALWLGIGAGAVALVAAILVGISFAQQPQPSGGSTGVVLSASPGARPGLSP